MSATEKQKIEDTETPTSVRVKRALGFAGHHLFSFLGAVCSLASTVNYSLSDLCDAIEDSDGPEEKTH